MPSSYQPELLIILSLGAGGVLLLHGLPKARGGSVQAGQWMESMGIPRIAADLVTVLKTAGQAGCFSS